MTRNRLEGRVAALEAWQEKQGIENGGLILIWGEDDLERNAKEALAEKLKGKVTPILLSKEDIYCL